MTVPNPPFRPYTAAEVCAITGVAPAVLDAWMTRVLPLRRAEPGAGDVVGLDDMQTFGVYVGRRWLDEGAGLARATKAMAVASGLTLEGLTVELAKGNSWPAAASGGPNLLVVPPKTVAGRRLNFSALMSEYRAAVRKVFPT